MSQNRASLQIEVESRGSKEAKGDLDSLADSGLRAERATDGFRKAIQNADQRTKEAKSGLTGLNKVIADQTKETTGLKKAMGDSWRSIEKSNESLYRHKKALNDIPKVKDQSSLFDRFRTKIDASSDSMDKMKSRAGGLGYQLQDTAVQLQSGASGFVVLGQQGSQVASMFGPGGAVFGAILAIGSALAGAAFGAMSTRNEIQELEESALQLHDAFNISSDGTLTYNERLSRIAKTAPEVAHALFQIKKQELELEQVLARNTLRDQLEDFSDLSTLLDNRTTQSFEKSKNAALFLTQELNNLKEEYGGTSSEIATVSRTLKDFNENASVDTASRLADSLSKLSGGSADSQKEIAKTIALLGQYIETSELLTNSNDPFEGHNKGVKSLVKSLELEAATLNKTNRERDLYIAKLGEATEEQFNAINSAYDDIEAQQSAKALERLETQLMGEEERIDASYVRRREIIIANTAETSELRDELLQANWEKYIADNDAYNNRLLSSDIKTAKQRDKLEKQVSASVIKQKEGVARAGLALLNTIAQGSKTAAAAALAVETALNIAQVNQNTAVASMAAMKYDPTGAMSAQIQSYGAIQAGLVMANSVLQFAGSSGSSAASFSTPSISPVANTSEDLPAQTSTTEIADTRPQYNLNFYGDITTADIGQIAEGLKEHITDADFVMIEASSRNGLELAA